VKRLRRTREQPALDVIRVVGEVKPPSVEPLFPPEHPERAQESWRTREQADLDAELDP